MESTAQLCFVAGGLGLNRIGTDRLATSPRRARCNPVVSTRMAIEHLNADSVDAVVTVASNPAFLMKITAYFDTLGLPAWLIKWGHPGAMGFMILGMGIPGAALGWVGRLSEDKKKGVELKKLHEGVMLAFWLLAFAGASGGTLSTAEQGFDIWQSKHFISSLVVLGLLSANAVLAYSGFGSSPASRIQGRTVHSYLGAATMLGLIIHGAIGLQQGLAM